MDSTDVAMKDAKTVIQEALRQLKRVQDLVGREAGGREVALAFTNAEQSLLWLKQAESIQPGYEG